MCFFAGYYLSSCTFQNDVGRTKIFSYPDPKPDSIPLTFLPGIVSTDSIDFNAAFSPDGRTFYFTRSENKRLRIYYTRFDNSWKTPVPVSFNEVDYSFADPAFSPDGKLYFISDRPENSADTIPDFDIWFVEPITDSTWSAPVNANVINSDSSEYYISFSMNSNLYFSSARAGGLGQEDIYVSRFQNGKYQSPINLGAAINTEKSEYDPGVSNDESQLVFSSSNRDDTFGGADLYLAKSSGKDWLGAVHLDGRFNTETREYCSAFSPDAKYFFFTSQKDVKWIEARHLR